jgi:hypothetical protein
MDLTHVKGLKKEEINQLSKNWITTSEEFASICLNEELSKNLQELLKVDVNRYTQIVSLILNSLSKEQIRKIKQFKNYQNKTGAKRLKK